MLFDHSTQLILKLVDLLQLFDRVQLKCFEIIFVMARHTCRDVIVLCQQRDEADYLVLTESFQRTQTAVEKCEKMFTGFPIRSFLSPPHIGLI